MCEAEAQDVQVLFERRQKGSSAACLVLAVKLSLSLFTISIS